MIVRIGQNNDIETTITVKSGEHFVPEQFAGDDSDLSLSIEEGDDFAITSLSFAEARALAAALIAATRGSL